jgi:hypothetical protein
MNVRHCARVIVVNEHREVLLLMYEDEHPVDPERPQLRRYWVTPGGGVETGETHEFAAARELTEETGIEEPRIGAWVWTREHKLMHKGELTSLAERYYVTHVGKADCPMRNRTVNEPIQRQRWWSLADLCQSDETFFPFGFAGLVEPILANRLPEAPILIREES